MECPEQFETLSASVGSSSHPGTILVEHLTTLQTTVPVVHTTVRDRNSDCKRKETYLLF